jgi:ketosteroid isomerase-like protein
MENTTQNVARLKHAYEQWHATRGGSKAVWLELAADNVQVGSLAEGAPGLEFTGRVSSREEFGRYFEGLLNDWEMIHYTADHFIADGARVVMRGSTAWRHKRTGREIDTPKADFVTFRDGKIVEFYEFYDTAALRDAVRT